MPEPACPLHAELVVDEFEERFAHAGPGAAVTVVARMACPARGCGWIEYTRVEEDHDAR